MPNELLSCPFCGGEAEYVCINGVAYVRCKRFIRCGAKGPTQPIGDDFVAKDIAIKAWNRRADNA